VFTRVTDRLRHLRARQQWIAFRHPLWHPAQFGVIAPTVAVLTGTLLLMLPAASRSGDTDASTALFTSASAVSLTGLTVVDTGSYWSPFGQWVLLGLMQVGGLGLMTFSSLLGLLIIGRLGLHSRLTPWSDTSILDLKTVLLVLRGVTRLSLLVEVVVWVLITPRIWLGHGEPFGEAVHLGLFHSVSSFTNSGFSLWPTSMLEHTDDPLLVLPLAGAFVLGGIGYPVIREVFRVHRPRDWSLHTRLTLVTTGILLVVGPLLVTLTEWNNPGTLGTLDVAHRIQAGWFSAASARSAGFAGIDFAEVEPATLITSMTLMLVGGGSGGTTGGVKVTTLAVLVLAVVSEARGRDDVEAFGRRISPSTVRQALAVGMATTLTIAVATFVMLETTALSLESGLFETVSAFANGGLSTGVTAEIPPLGRLLLIVLMFVGLVGPITLGSVLALRQTRRTYRLPEARPIVG
jgi:Trk-type K+ transport system membrane component